MAVNVSASGKGGVSLGGNLDLSQLGGSSPAVGSTIMLNDISFEIIGVVTKIGQDGNNGTNARIFIPIETMRNLFRIKDQNTEDAISFINYRPLTPAQDKQAKSEVHEIVARRLDPYAPVHAPRW